jgi:Fe-S-cluster-containing dehydrogenase component
LETVTETGGVDGYSHASHGRLVVIGLVGVLFALAAQAEGCRRVRLGVSKAAKLDNCVEPTEYMRRNHMELIRHQRDTTVYGGIRSTKHSMAGCVNATSADDQQPVPVNGDGQFCEACHDYAAVTLNCFDCHATVPEGEAWNHEVAAQHAHMNGQRMRRRQVPGARRRPARSPSEREARANEREQKGQAKADETDDMRSERAAGRRFLGCRRRSAPRPSRTGAWCCIVSPRPRRAPSRSPTSTAGACCRHQQVRRWLHRLRRGLRQGERPQPAGQAPRRRRAKVAEPARDWIRKVKLQDNVSGYVTNLPLMCQHCENPPCVDVCPTGASFKRADGIVMVDRHTCIGCRYCMMACPYKARSFIHEQVEQKLTRAPRGKGCVESCNLCAHRLDDGETTTACAEACAAEGHNAIMFGDLNDPTARCARRWRAAKPADPRGPGLNTGVRYAGI